MLDTFIFFCSHRFAILNPKEKTCVWKLSRFLNRKKLTSLLTMNDTIKNINEKEYYFKTMMKFEAGF